MKKCLNHWVISIPLEMYCKLYSPDEIRLFVLQTHYRNPIEFSSASLQATAPSIQRLVRALECLSTEDEEDEEDIKRTESENVSEKKPELNTDYLKQFDSEFVQPWIMISIRL